MQVRELQYTGMEFRGWHVEKNMYMYVTLYGNRKKYF